MLGTLIAKLRARSTSYLRAWVVVTGLPHNVPNAELPTDTRSVGSSNSSQSSAVQFSSVQFSAVQ